MIRENGIKYINIYDSSFLFPYKTFYDQCSRAMVSYLQNSFYINMFPLKTIITNLEYERKH